LTSGANGRERGARAAVLEAIRAALADAPTPVDVPRDYDLGLAPGADPVALFVDRVGDYRATVHRATATDLAATVAAVLAEHEVARLAVPAGLPEAWLADAAVESVGDDPPLSHRELDALDGVVTGCAVAIAETGTIVLDGGAGQGRRALSLLPDLHVCVVSVDRIVGSVPEALARLDPHRPLTWISGPSATSDIELQRVEGVHGPRRLEVIVLGER
jgi:L-lactate dehydrogenase complex protein LldG